MDRLSFDAEESAALAKYFAQAETMEHAYHALSEADNQLC
jgi:hypothetical protein